MFTSMTYKIHPHPDGPATGCPALSIEVVSGPERDVVCGASEPMIAGSRVSGVCCEVKSKQTDEVWNSLH